MSRDKRQQTVAVVVRLTPDMVEKLDALARETYRSRGQILRMLVERVTLNDLETWRSQVSDTERSRGVVWGGG